MYASIKKKKVISQNAVGEETFHLSQQIMYKLAPCSCKQMVIWVYNVPWGFDYREKWSNKLYPERFESWCGMPVSKW